MSKIDTAIVSGGLGSSQCEELADALTKAGLRVVMTPFENGYMHVEETIQNTDDIGKLALVGHSFFAIPGIDAAKKYGACYLGLIDPVSCRAFVSEYYLPDGVTLGDWFIAKPTPFITRMGIPNSPIPPQQIDGFHNQIPHDAAVISQILANIQKAFGEEMP